MSTSRVAVPLRIGLALSTTPWVQANAVDKIGFLSRKMAWPSPTTAIASASASSTRHPPATSSRIRCGWSGKRSSRRSARPMERLGRCIGGYVGWHSICARDLLRRPLKSSERAYRWLFYPPSALYQRGAAAAAAAALPPLPWPSPHQPLRRGSARGPHAAAVAPPASAVTEGALRASRPDGRRRQRQEGEEGKEGEEGEGGHWRQARAPKHSGGARARAQGRMDLRC